MTATTNNNTTNNNTTTTFVPIAIYIPIAIPVTSTLTPIEIQKVMNNSLTSLNAKTFNFPQNTEQFVQNELEISPLLSGSIDKLNQQNFTLIEKINENLQSSHASTTCLENISYLKEDNEISSDVNDTTSYQPPIEILSTENSDTYPKSCIDSEEALDRHYSRQDIRSTIDSTSSDHSTINPTLPPYLVCQNNYFNNAILRQIDDNSSIMYSLYPNAIGSATCLGDETQYCLNWDNPRPNCNNNQRCCCVFTNVSNQIFFPVTPVSPCPPLSPSPSISSPSSSLLRLSLFALLLRNLYSPSGLLSLSDSLPLQMLYYCLFMGFKSSFDFSSQQQQQQDQQRRREERGKKEGKGGKGGKGDEGEDDEEIIDIYAHAYAADYAYHVVDHHVVVSSLVAPIANLAIRATA